MLRVLVVTGDLIAWRAAEASLRAVTRGAPIRLLHWASPLEGFDVYLIDERAPLTRDTPSSFAAAAWFACEPADARITRVCTRAADGSRRAEPDLAAVVRRAMLALPSAGEETTR